MRDAPPLLVDKTLFLNSDPLMYGASESDTVCVKAGAVPTLQHSPPRWALPVAATTAIPEDDPSEVVMARVAGRTSLGSGGRRTALGALPSGCCGRAQARPLDDVVDEDREGVEADDIRRIGDEVR
jgi:hypothetical protein